MEIKHWTYEDFPEFDQPVEGAEVLSTTGDEVGFSYFHDVEYANVEKIPLHLQIIKPFTRNEPKKIYPCMVFVQGSAWMKQDVYAKIPMLARLAGKGYTIAVVEYRHSGQAPFPAQALDARNAVRFMRKNSKSYQIDPEKIVIGGDSSGGHTAMFAGILQDDDQETNLYPGISAGTKGILNYYGSVSVMLEDSNPNTINHHMPDSPEGMEMGGVNLKERPDLCRRLSVECNITEDTDLPPVLIFHGTKDRIVNTRQSVNLYRRLKETGKEACLYLIRGADHGGAEFWTEETCNIADRFIKKCLL